MKTLITALCAATLSFGTVAASMPAQAAPMYQSHQQQQQQHWKFHKKGNYAYLNGHRGDRHRHAGWRYYNGYYFPPAAFVIGGLIFGGILGAIIANQH
jgi:outer membrane biogenesis lipoprotein LolB